MKIRILGGGFYGSHLARALLADGHEIEIHEIADRLFAGASGNMPARLHGGQHYPRSRLTRAACHEHRVEFMSQYGHLTHGVPINIYAIASHDSLVDLGTYTQLLRGEIEFVTIERPEEFGLCNVEGAILTGERHIIVDRAREFFSQALEGHVHFGMPVGDLDDPRWDLTIDATFCSYDSENIDRYEACLTVLLEGPTDRSVTIMDGGFPGIYQWDESRGLSSLTSAKYTPMIRRPTWKAARQYLDHLSPRVLDSQIEAMVEQMAFYYPRVRDEYRVVGHLLAVRAMPRSAADARLVDIISVGTRAIRVRAGKIDAIFHAERVVKEMIRTTRSAMMHAAVG